MWCDTHLLFARINGPRQNDLHDWATVSRLLRIANRIEFNAAELSNAGNLTIANPELLDPRSYILD